MRRPRIYGRFNSHPLPPAERQGRCDCQGPFTVYVWLAKLGPLSRAHCPHCGEPLARTSCPIGTHPTRVQEVPVFK